MYAISLGDDGAELRPLEPWHAEEFLAHLDRGRDFPRPCRGLVTRGMRVLIDWAFDERGIHRVEWYASSADTASINVARRLGMRRDGVLRESHLYRGVRQDIEVWPVLAPEWRAARARTAHNVH